MSFIIFIVILILVQDNPPTPATKAQVQLRHQSADSTPNTNSILYSSIKDFLKESKRILSNDVMLYVCIIGTLRFGFMVIQIIFFGEITRPIFSKMHLLSDQNGLSGIVLGSYEISMLTAILVFGKLMDRFHKHLLSIRLSFLCAFFAYLGTILGIYFSNIIVLWLFYAIVGFAVGVSSIPLHDTAVQHMFPAKPGLVMALITLVISTGTPILAQFSRLLLKFGGDLAFLIFSLLLFLAAFLLSWALKPNFKRLKLNTS